MELSHHRHWLKLLHYSQSFYSKPKSDIVSSDFFLAKDGATNPVSELKATIEGLKKSQEVYCKFPARRGWLEKKGMNFPSYECSEFAESTRNHSVKSVSLIFASGFLGNPASYFGHPLLKFNFKDERSPLDLLDTAVNYGAFTPKTVDPFSYAIFGIFGGYEAGFTSTDFFFHKNNYSELELRDLWEYELKLSQEQVNEIVAHVWEMRKARINYYFSHDNCAYRMAELLELVVDKELISRKLPFAIPSAIFHRLYEKSLVSDIKLIKSRQTRLREKVFSLTEKEKTELKLITEDVNHLESTQFQSLKETEKQKILETAMDHYSFRSVLNEDQSFSDSKRKVLLKRIALAPHEVKWKSIRQNPPHKAQRPVLTAPGYFYSEKFGNGASLRLRPAFYDLVSPDSARPALSEMSVLDLEINVNDERLWLKSFRLISVETLNLSKTQLKGDGGVAWRFNVGADQLNLACNTCTVAKLEVGGGKAWELSRSLVLYAMIDPRIQTLSQDSGYLNVTPNISTLITFSDDFRVNGTIGRRFYFNNDHTAENVYKIEGRIGSSRTWDLRMSFQEHIDRRYGLGFGYYW